MKTSASRGADRETGFEGFDSCLGRTDVPKAWRRFAAYTPPSRDVNFYTRLTHSELLTTFASLGSVMFNARRPRQIRNAAQWGARLRRLLSLAAASIFVSPTPLMAWASNAASARPSRGRGSCDERPLCSRLSERLSERPRQRRGRAAISTRRIPQWLAACFSA
jgi:hypothetical protein